MFSDLPYPEFSDTGTWYMVHGTEVVEVILKACTTPVLHHRVPAWSKQCSSDFLHVPAPAWRHQHARTRRPAAYAAPLEQGPAFARRSRPKLRISYSPSIAGVNLLVQTIFV